ncbi:hypothetical protein FZI85_22800 [Mycobacterium sp. CBMA293]|uniref:DUF2231 domain-containing protein n=1 Tax=unclassified Mycolicibacterium TaxID=2636767 RepID=UPI00132B10B2|nr:MULTISPECIES: DUF2231 domain-containing protein [unclassified Mycolicibacterium]MUL45909.1 hypothetical protein [Mycolicibacterium sp. CBMA 360]MUL95203.1 hypothetical protein [Mycolicibacterium sp. CBMA 230]MUM34230.1 hypothetical protein [Mycolicibacterium sp. CBMA 361]MUL60581.1 hypothetical protein [Mycolicibacterium sp. CBMA 335]MUL72396.1 hypothetical protein [Mycolicibacterium sp. CBMA 311]
MNTIGDIPAHPFFVHFIVVLAPLTAILLILCAVWPAARDRLVWLVVALSVAVTVLTPLTTGAGEWLEHQQKQRGAISPILHQHAEAGDTMIYGALGLLVVSLVLAALHLRGERLAARRKVATIVVAVLAVVIGVSTIVQVVRIGDTGAHAVWGGGS